MAALCSSSGDVIRVTKNHGQHSRLDAVGGADWSSLPEDLLLIIMAALDIPSLLRSGTVCSSWHDACSSFRRLRCLSPKQAPCLLYACDEFGPNHAALYCPSTSTTFRVPFPHHNRGRFFSSNGWVFATDDVADPYLLNPITGAKATLPSVKTLPCTGMEISLDDDGNLSKADIERVQDNVYWRVAISACDDAATCTVLLVHLPGQMLSFAKPGDEQWTLLSGDLCLADVCYNEKNSLFYGLCTDGSIYVFHLSEPSPTMTRIMCGVINFVNPTKYLTFTPSGELLQVWRIWDEGKAHTQIKPHWTYEDILRFTAQDCVDFIGRGDEEKLGDLGTDEEKDNGEPWLKMAVATSELLIFKVDIDRQKLMELRSIGEHTLFLGYNSTVCLPSMDFPAFEPNRAYLADDCSQFGQIVRRDLGIWNFEKRNLQNLREAWTNLTPWLDLSAPIWITPSLF
jgi:hypothetical protein